MDTDIAPPLWGSCRLAYAFCGFFSNIAHVCMTASVNLAIMCMQKEPESSKAKALGFQFACGEHHNTSASQTYTKHGELDWTKPQQWHFVGCYYYGLMIMQPIAGRIVDRFGAKWFLTCGLMGAGTVFSSLPFFSRRNYHLAVGVRVFQGFIAAFIPTSIYKLFAVWSHSEERQGLMTVTHSGSYVASLLIFPISSMLCHVGWAYVFYCIGFCTIVLSIILMFLVHENIDTHPRISEGEYNYLKNFKAPFKEIFTAMPVIAFIITHVCNAYGYIITFLYMPRFYKEELNLSVTENGFYIPFITLGLLSTNIVMAFTINKLWLASKLSITNFRRLVLVFGNSLLIVFYLLISAMSCEQRHFIVFIFFFIGCAMSISFSGGYWPTAIDLAPSYAGLIVGVANSSSNLNGVVVPSLLSYTILSKGSKYVFSSVAFMELVGIIMYGTFGSSERLILD